MNELALLVPAVAMLLDLALGDPKRLPHPVRGIGKVLDRIEQFVRARGWPLGWAGLGAVLAVAGGSALTAWLACRIPLLGPLLALYLAFAGLGLGCLVREGRSVAKLIDRGEIEAARAALALLVTRDTSNLDVPSLRRTLAETVSENLNDAFVAPFLYLALFGPAGLWAYKAVSTMDSMWGYRTERFARLGHAAAKADDVLAWPTARLTALLMVLAGMLLGLDWRAAFRRTPGDARKMESPNAGWPMSAAAWLFGAGMGGPAVYFGELKDKPRLGPDGEWGRREIRLLLRLGVMVGLLCAGVYVGVVVWVAG
jgi:adenosylcobinamide-phosphate synthase